MTRLYLANDNTGIYLPATKRGAWDKTTGAFGFRLAATRTGHGEDFANTETVTTANYDVLVGVHVSDPLLANTTISGTLDLIVGAAESNADADDMLHLHVWVTQGDSDTVRGTLLADYIDATEFAVSAGISAFTSVAIPQQSVTSVAALAGDRIVVELGYRAANTIVSSRSAGFSFGGRSGSDLIGGESALTGQTNPSPWIELSTTLVFAPSYLYLANATAPGVAGAVAGTWNVDAKADLALTRTKTGAEASRTGAETSTTNPTDVLIHRFISDELAAQTIAAGAVDVLLKLTENAADADAFAKVHLWVMQPDGTGRGTLLANAVGAGELTGDVRRITGTLSSLAVSAGDRLVLEVGARFTNVTATSKNVTHRAGNTTNDTGVGPVNADTAASSGTASWLRMAQRLLWLADAPAAMARSQVIVIA